MEVWRPEQTQALVEESAAAAAVEEVVDAAAEVVAEAVEEEVEEAVSIQDITNRSSGLLRHICSLPYAVMMTFAMSFELASGGTVAITQTMQPICRTRKSWLSMPG